MPRAEPGPEALRGVRRIRHYDRPAKIRVLFELAGDEVRDQRYPMGKTTDVVTDPAITKSTFAHEFSGIGLWNPSAFDIWTLIALMDCVEALIVSCRKSPTNQAGVVIRLAFVDKSFAT
jgi:hypothetical protein